MHQLYTIAQVAERLHKTPRWTRGYVLKSRFYRKAGRTILCMPEDLMRLIGQLRGENVIEPTFSGPPQSKSTTAGMRANHSRERDGHIYFLAHNDAIKIGFSSNIISRLKQIKTDSPGQLELLYIEKGTPIQEKSYHYQFNKHRIRGEWFKKSNEILAFIALKKQTQRLGQ